MKDYSENAKLDFCLENDIEFWKEVPNYNGIYSISTFGNVRNNETGRILKQFNNKPDGSGYLKVMFYKNGKAKEFLVHRLVLITFVGPKPENCEADHKDRQRTNNKLINLHWVSRKQNNRNKSTNRKVNQYDLENNYIKTFNTIVEAVEELNVDYHSGTCNINSVVTGKSKTAYGFRWKYADEENN